MDIAEQIYGAIDILVNNKIKSINFNTTIDGTIVDASRAKEGRYKVQDETARSFIAYSNQTDYKENDNVLITIPNGDYTEQKIIVGKKVGNVENTSFKYTSPLSTMIPLVRCALSGTQREWPMYANQNEVMICPILEEDFSQNPLIGYTRIGLTADFSTWLKELNTVEGSYGIVCTCAFAKNGLAGEKEYTQVNSDEAFNEDEDYYILDPVTNKYAKQDNLTGFETGKTYYKFKYHLDADSRTVVSRSFTTSADGNQATTDDNIEFVNFLLDSATDFYGDVYNFQDYFAQETVFDISRFSDQRLLYVLVSFYQRQDFKDNKGNYIPAPTFESQKLKVALLNYKNHIADDLSAPDLPSYYALDGTNGLSTIVSVDEDFVSAMPNLYVREPQVILGYNLGDFENDSSFLFSQSSNTYNTTKTDEENKKLIELRWVHDFNGEIKDVTRDDFWNPNLKDYNIRWYRHKLGAPSPDQYTGVYWELLKSYQYNSATENTDPIFQLEIIPDTNLDYEEFKVIIVKNYSIISESNAIIFENEQSTENMTQTDKSNALSIACGHPKFGDSEQIAAPEDRFYKDAYQGMFFIYKKGNQLIDDSKALEKLFLTPVFNSVKTDYEPDENSEYNAGDITILSDAQVIIWSFPASHTMLRPIAKESAASNETFILASEAPSALISYDDYPYFENTNCKRSLIVEYTTTRDEDTISERKIYTKIFYNRTLDTLEFVHILSNDVPDGQVDLSLDDCGIIQPYYIAKTYTPSAVNNTVGLEIIKDRIRYSTSKTMYFGQAGTSGSDYTLVVNFKNNQNAVCIQEIQAEDENWYAADYFGPDNYNALIASVRLIGQDGKDAIDFNNIAASDSYTITFEIAESQINGYTDSNYRSTQKEKSRIYYPVSFSGQPSRKEDGSDKNYQDFSNPSHAEFSDGIAVARYIIDDGDWDAERDWSKYYYFSLDTLSDPDPAETKAGTFFALEESPVDVPHAENYQYYRQLDLDNDDIALREQPKDKITYKLCEAMNAALYAQLDGPMFINYSGVYVLDPFFDNTGYNEAQDYYYPVLAEESVDIHPVLKIENESPFAEHIVFNSSHECLIHLDDTYWTSEDTNWTFEHQRPSAEHIMNSVTILKVTLSGFGDYDLVTYVPIPLRRVCFYTDPITHEKSVVDWVQSVVGATEIRYSSSGEVPDYYKNPYIAKVENNGTIEENESNNWRIICPLDANSDSNFRATLKTYTENSVEKCVLSPLSVYIPNAPLFGVGFKPEGETLWSQPILVYQDNYPSSTINAWDGKSITTDEETGSILSSAIAAGKKVDNKFSGVMLGDWSRSDTDASVSKQTGLYGFHEGGMSFAFKEDGTAFIGKDGYGRIHLAGNKAQIYSSSWILGQQGMLLDLNKGSMKLVQKSKYSAKSFASKTAYEAFLANSSNPSLYEFFTYRPLTTTENSDEAANRSTITDFYIPKDLIIQSVSVLDKNLIIPNYYYYFYYTTTEEILVEQTDGHQTGSFNDEDFPEITNNTIKITYITCTKDIKGKRESGELIEDPDGTITCCKVEITTVYKVMIAQSSGLQTMNDLRERQQKMADPTDTTYYVGTEDVSIRVVKNYQSLKKNTTYQYDFPKTTGSLNKYTIESKTRSYTNLSGLPVFLFYSNYIKVNPTTSISRPREDNATLSMYIPYNPNFTYYTKDEAASTFGDSRYVTVSAAEATYPLAIGAQESVGQRPFRVRWDGNVYIEDGVFTGTITATGGAITGNLDVTGTLTGGSFYTGYLEANEGIIGGWTINNTSLTGGSKASGTETILSSRDGITTHALTIKTNIGSGSNISLAELGTIGLIKGNDGTSTTYNIGIVSASAKTNPTTPARSIILDSKLNFRISAVGEGYINPSDGLYIGEPDAYVRSVMMNISSATQAADDGYTNSSGLPTINDRYIFHVGVLGKADKTYWNDGKPVLYTNIPAEDQHGIYARFA